MASPPSPHQSDRSPSAHGDRAPRPTADLAGITTRFLDVHGVRVHVGEVDGTTGGRDEPSVGVVLLHHFYGNVATWRRVLTRLDGRGIAAVAVDRPGFGWTERPSPAKVGRLVADGAPNPWTRSFGVRAARAAIDDAGWDQVVIVGSSMGGTLAIELAATLEAEAAVTATDPGPDPGTGTPAAVLPHAPSIAHLVLLSPALTGDVGMPPLVRPLLRAAWIRRAMRPLVNALSRRIDLERVAGGWFDQSLADQDDIEAYRVQTRLPGWADGIWQVMTVESPPDLRATARRIAAPTTVVSGHHDRTVRPKWNRRTATGMGARLVEVETGHTPHEEAPGLVTDLIADLVTRTGGTVAVDPDEHSLDGTSDATTDGMSDATAGGVAAGRAD